MRVTNVHERLLPGTLERVGELIDGLAGPDDRLWPGDRWPPMRFDRPLAVGAAGGHGPIRYRVEAYQPGRRVAFRFTGMAGLEGGHHLEAEPAGGGAVRLRHVAEGRMRGRMLVVWPLVIRPLHDALIEDLLDRAELALTGTVATPNRWSPWVRLVRGRAGPGLPGPVGSGTLRSQGTNSPRGRECPAAP